MNDRRRISYKIYYRLLVAELIKLNYYNERVHQLIKLPKIENELFKLRCFVKNGDVCIDVGANVGMYSIMLSRICGKNGTVLSFEPTPEVFHYLSKIIRNGINKLSNVKLYQMALGNHTGNVSLIFQNEKNGEISDTLTRIGEDQGAVRMTTLDAVVKKLELREVNFIKIDVEGYELKVLKGSVELLQKYHPILLMEIDNMWLARYGSSYEEILSFLSSLGYKQVILEECSFRIASRKYMGNVYFKWFE